MTINPEKLMADLAGELRMLALKGHIATHICYFDGRVAARWSGHTRSKHKIFRNFRHSPLEEGFTSAEWTALIKPIILYIEELEKCRNPQKRSPDQNATFF